MKAEEVIECGQGGAYYTRGRIAKQMDNFEFENIISRVTVSTKAPCCIKHDGSYPKQLGWVELEGELEYAGNPYIPCEIWIKTATVGGRRRTWVRNMY
jgi:hypothetical protein